MAIAFKNTSTTVATADTMETMYTAPGGVTGSIVHAIYIANKHLTSAIVCSLVLACVKDLSRVLTGRIAFYA